LCRRVIEITGAKISNLSIFKTTVIEERTTIA
jgi:hypothetical protein